MAKRGRPKRDTLDQITEDAAVHWVVDQKRLRSGASVKAAQGKVADESNMTDRKVRAAYERFGRLLSKKNDK